MKAAITKTKSDTSGIHLWLVLWKAYRSVEEHAQRHIAGLGLGLSDFGVLEALLHKGPLYVKDLGTKVMLTSGSMTAALDRLERRGLIDREEDSEDRRARLIRLTETGETFIRVAFEEHMRAMDVATSGVGKRDRELLIDLLRQLGFGAVKALDLSANKGVAAKSGGKKE